MKSILLTLVLLLISGPSLVIAENPDPETVISGVIETEFPELELTNIRESQIPGLYEVLLGNEVVYMSAEGRYILQGTLYDLEQRVNLSEEVKALTRIDVLKEIPKNEMIEFNPERTEHVVYVFTDIDCGFCRRLHNDIHELNSNGIAVRYLAFPRSGVDSKTYKNMVSVWCSDNQHEALTRAKLGKIVKLEQCDNPVARHRELGQDIGVRGTPAVFLENGKQIGGYLTPEEMLEVLNES